MQGTILQVNISNGGLPKWSVPEGLIGPLGVSGDLHKHMEFHGGPEKALLLIANEILEELKAQGYPLFPGAMGENLTTSGLDVRALRLGDRLRAGTVELELTRIRKPCKQLWVYGQTIGDAVYDQQVKAGDPASPRWGMSGFYARVLSEGTVRTGDAIYVAARQP